MEVCTRAIVGTDRLAGPCPACGHTTLVHPGWPNESLFACAICELVQATEQAREQASR